MQIRSIIIKNFRCFSNLSLDFSNKFVLIKGNNGVGKTSLLEAIHYLCYLRSFRTQSPKELVQFKKDHFFIKIICESNQEENVIQVGFTGKTRLVKVNATSISSYKELLDYYRVVTLQEDDLHLIKGGPEARRAFIDQHLIFFDPSFMEIIKKYRIVLNNRNSLLKAGYSKKNIESHSIWTEQLWVLSCEIQNRRIKALQDLQEKINFLVSKFFHSEFVITFSYKFSRIENIFKTFGDFQDTFQIWYQDEYRYGRSLFGAHLDDFTINFKDKGSREFASRGQQKLIIALLKISQIKLLHQLKGASLFLLDDFMTDFDEIRSKLFVPLFEQLSGQIIMTSPLTKSYWGEYLESRGVQVVALSEKGAI